MRVDRRQCTDFASTVKSEPINLRVRYGTRYRIVHDPAYHVEDPRWRHAEEPWLQIILGRNGHVYPDGGDYLVASTNTVGSVASRLRQLPTCKVVQDGDDGLSVRFHVSQFETVARLLRLFRRRVPSERQRSALAIAGAAHRFQRRQ